MKICVHFLTAIVIALVAGFALSACGGASAKREVVFDDAAHIAAADEVVLSDAEVASGNSTDEIAEAAAAAERKNEPLKILADKSELETAYDGYGNKSETRYFKNHPRLKFVMVRTAADGARQIFVYGYAGGPALMPEDFSEKALTAPADDIANAAGLKARRGDGTQITNFLRRSEGSNAPPPPPAQLPQQTAPPPQNQTPQAAEEPSAAKESAQPDSLTENSKQSVSPLDDDSKKTPVDDLSNQ
jgi:hypothetical protein